MKFVGLFLLLALYAAFSESKPLEDTNTKCQNFCDLLYSPICGTDDEGQTRTFSNLCVLKSENCLHKSSFQKTSDGPCP